MTTLERTAAGAPEIALPTRELGTSVWKWMTTTDHKVIGNLYFITSFIWFILAGIMALVIRAELATPGLQFVDTRVIRRSLEGLDGVVLRGVGRGHPLFGPACELIRAEALVRLDSEPPLPSGLLALGQREAQGFETRHGSELLMFLGRVLTRSMGRWLIP